MQIQLDSPYIHDENPAALLAFGANQTPCHSPAMTR
jgi:hypothetical protein